MRAIGYLLLAPLLGFLTSAVCASALSWDELVKTITVGAGESRISARYTFHNHGNTPVSIVALSTSCGCTVATLDKKSYVAGESGAVSVVFSPGERVGLQDKTISVMTDEANEVATTLELKVDIREYLTIEPSVLYWPLAKGKTEQAIFCTATDAKVIASFDVSTNNPNFVTRVETLEPGRKYRLLVRPTVLSPDDSVVLSLQVQILHGPLRNLSAYGYIK